MDDKHLVFESTVLGFIVVAFAWVFFYVINDHEALEVFRLLHFSFSGESRGASEALAILVILGAALSSLGLVVRLLSIFRYQGTHGTDAHRKALAEKIQKVVKDCHSIECPVRCGVMNSKPDPLFVWIQYSDPRNALREWGRTRRRYMYVGENWKTAIYVGITLGLLAGILSGLENIWSPNIWRLYALFAGVLGALGWNVVLDKVVRHNREAEESMVSIYAAEILCPRLRSEFLHHLKDSGEQTGVAARTNKVHDRDNRGANTS